MRFVPVWGLCLATVVACGSDGSEPGERADAAAGGDASVGDDATVRDDATTGGGDAAAGGDAADGTLCTSCGDCEESERITSALHVSTPIDYPDPPPMGGNHAGCWTSYGEHTREVADEVWVHNLEHGAIVLLYNCPEGCPTELAWLREQADRPFVLLTPYAALPPGSFAAVAWGYRLVSSCLDEQAIERFYEEHVDRAPESITADGSC